MNKRILRQGGSGTKKLYEGNNTIQCYFQCAGNNIKEVDLEEIGSGMKEEFDLAVKNGKMPRVDNIPAEPSWKRDNRCSILAGE